MRLRLRTLFVLAWLAAVPTALLAQQAATLAVVVQDETQARLIHAEVTIVDLMGVERTVSVDDHGVATFRNVAPGTYQVLAVSSGFQATAISVDVARGTNEATVQLPVAIEEEVAVEGTDASARRDNGFSQTLTPEEIEALSDDPDEMADELAQMAGPGAQIFVDGFRGGRLPPKDQIQSIRFQRNSFAAEYHDAGMVRVEIITRPGFGNWRGRFNFGFRDESLNARDAFAPITGPEQQKRYMFNFNGPIQQGKTSLGISADGLASYQSETVVARTPAGELNDLVRRPTDNLNASVRLDHELSQGNQIRTEFSRRTSTRSNLGVGNFNLADRAYEQEQVTDQFRVRNTRVYGKSVFSELRLEARRSETSFLSTSAAPAVRVIDAFTSGGAGRDGVRTGTEIELAQNFDWTVNKKHSMRAGLLFESAWWDSTQTTNANGTFTFRTLDDYLAGRASQFSRLVGDPNVSYSQQQLGLFVQDDFQIGKTFSLSVGARHELQTNLDDKWNLAPRVGFTWSPRRVKVNVRGGYGMFYDWFETNLFEQTIQVDGTHQLEEVIIDPSYPDASLSTAGTVLPPSIIRVGDHLELPVIHQASIGFDRQLAPWMTMRADYLLLRGTGQFRSINANAPVNGVRPDQAVGNITEILSTGRSATDRLSVGLMMMVPGRRIMGNVTYQLGSSRNYADSALALPSDSTNPDADWGPAANDVRHRLMLMFNTPLPYGVRANVMVQGSSGTPYTITTGYDDNGDTVFNDRPAGVGRNTARGSAQWNVNLRLNKSIPLGGVRGGGPGEPTVIGGDGPPPQALAQRGPGGGGGGPMMMMMDGNASRYRLDIYAQVSNLLNATNYTGWVGNQLSSFFGQATNAMPARRVELGVSVMF
ncbi:MAG: carboxypeptidase regulatory-like domain-containing protein [Vicinamibacterales bacterium]